MDMAGRRRPIKQSPPAGTNDAADIGRTEGPRIELGMGRRRVTGHDLFLYHALVSRNDQNFGDLSELHPNDDAQMDVYARQVRPKFVTESWLERFNVRFTRWMMRRWQTISGWLHLNRNAPVPTKPSGQRQDFGCVCRMQLG